MPQRTLTILLICCVLLLPSCAKPTAAPTPTPTFTPEPTPTATLEPTPTPTSTPAPCSVQSQEFITQWQALFREWEDADRLARSTARIALSQPISQLQSLRRRLEDLAAPSCARAVKVVMSAYMDATIDSYLAFMAQASDGTVASKSENAKVLLDTLKETMNKVGHDEPFSVHSVRFVAGGNVDFMVIYSAPGVLLGGPGMEQLKASWSESTVVSGKQSVSLNVFSVESGKLFCEIWIDEKLADRQTSSAPNCSATTP